MQEITRVIALLQEREAASVFLNSVKELAALVDSAHAAQKASMLRSNLKRLQRDVTRLTNDARRLVYRDQAATLTSTTMIGMVSLEELQMSFADIQADVERAAVQPAQLPQLLSQAMPQQPPPDDFSEPFPMPPRQECMTMTWSTKS